MNTHLARLLLLVFPRDWPPARRLPLVLPLRRLLQFEGLWWRLGQASPRCTPPTRRPPRPLPPPLLGGGGVRLGLHVGAALRRATSTSFGLRLPRMRSGFAVVGYATPRCLPPRPRCRPSSGSRLFGGVWLLARHLPPRRSAPSRPRRSLARLPARLSGAQGQPSSR